MAKGSSGMGNEIECRLCQAGVELRAAEMLDGGGYYLDDLTDTALDGLCPDHAPMADDEVVFDADKADSLYDRKREPGYGNRY